MVNNRHPSHLEALDCNTLQHILTKLDARGLASLCCVSRYFRSQASDVSLWKLLTCARWTKPNTLLFQKPEGCSDPGTGCQADSETSVPLSANVWLQPHAK